MGYYWSRGALLLSIVGTVAILGCAGAPPNQLADDQPTPLHIRLPGSSDASDSAALANSPARPASASRNATRTPGSPASTVSSFGSSLSGALERATHKVSDAMAMKPKVVPAADSVELANMPGQLSPILYVRGAAFSEAKGDLAGAQQQYEKALELGPHDTTALIAYARFRDRIGDSTQALEVYQRARAVEPNNATVWNDLAMCHARRGEVEPALSAIQQAVALKPDNKRYRNNLAAILVQAGRPEDAVHELQKVHPPAVANHNVACLLLRLRNQALAAEYLRRAVNLDPSLERARLLLTRLGESSAPLPPNQRATGPSSVGVPLEQTAEPRVTDARGDTWNSRSTPWETAARDTSYGSHRESGQKRGLQRFPRVER